MFSGRGCWLSPGIQLSPHHRYKHPSPQDHGFSTIAHPSHSYLLNTQTHSPPSIWSPCLLHQEILKKPWIPLCWSSNLSLEFPGACSGWGNAVPLFSLWLLDLLAEPSHPCWCTTSSLSSFSPSVQVGWNHQPSQERHRWKPTNDLNSHPTGICLQSPQSEKGTEIMRKAHNFMEISLSQHGFCTCTEYTRFN